MTAKAGKTTHSRGWTFVVLFVSLIQGLFGVCLPLLYSMPSNYEVGVGLWAAVSGLCSAFLWVRAAFNPEHAAFNIGAAALSGAAIVLATATIKYPDYGGPTTFISEYFYKVCIGVALLIVLAAMGTVWKMEPHIQTPAKT